MATWSVTPSEGVVPLSETGKFRFPENKTSSDIEYKVVCIDDGKRYEKKIKVYAGEECKEQPPQHEYRISVEVYNLEVPTRECAFTGAYFFIRKADDIGYALNGNSCLKQRCYGGEETYFTGETIDNLFKNFISADNQYGICVGEYSDGDYDENTGLTVYNYGVNCASGSNPVIMPSDQWVDYGLENWNGFKIKFPDGQYTCKIVIDWAKDNKDLQVDVTYQ